MEDCTRVVLYGTFDGAAFSTDNFLQIAVILDSGEKVEIPTECVTSADQIVKKDEIKLKDVIKRIEKFDLGTKAVWINGILNELGSDYGTFKYKAGYEQGKFDGAVECEKVTIPQFVADWIEKCKVIKKFKVSLAYAINSEVWSENSLSDECIDWLYNANNQETFARAWLDGYEVEKERRYLVKMKGIEENINCLNYDYSESEWFLADEVSNSSIRTHHTRKELEEANFGWVFDCEGIKIEEVEG